MNGIRLLILCLLVCGTLPADSADSQSTPAAVAPNSDSLRSTSANATPRGTEIGDAPTEVESAMGLFALSRPGMAFGGATVDQRRNG